MKRISIFLMTVMVVFGFSLSAGAEPGSAPLVLAANVGPSFATSAPEMPTVEMPIVTKNTVMRVSGTFRRSAKVPLIVIAGRLQIVDGTSNTASFFDVFFDVIPDKSFPNLFAFRTVIKLSELGVDLVGDGNASLTLDALSKNLIPLGYFTAGVYVEETSAQFVPYVSWLAEPRPDPVLPLPLP